MSASFQDRAAFAAMREPVATGALSARQAGVVGVSCPPHAHRHDTVPTGGRCAFPDERRPSGLCGRDPVALYVNPFAAVLNTYRCDRHDKAVVVEAAAEMGFQRIEVTW